MNLQKIGAIVATGALFASLATGAFANTSIIISGNGAGSVNGSSVKNISHASTTQKSKTAVFTFVGQSASTGDNTASSNVGGTTSITTGSASNGTVVDVTGGDNNNQSTSPVCCCSTTGNTAVSITGNGAGSVNESSVLNKCSQKTTQKNTTTVVTGVLQEASTGGNTASGNVGSGTTITSGNAANAVSVSVTGGSNTINPTPTP